MRCLIGNVGTLFNGADSAFDEGRRVFGRFSRLAGQVSYLVRHNGKPFSGLPGPRGFYRSVQGKDIGLESNILYCLNDLADLS